ncbi:MAG TPA: hypothetical protein VKD67_08510 [Acidimicrobiales bacterium]|nr:hypothetical protein [Acidimicrobiales bacterium]
MLDEHAGDRWHVTRVGPLRWLPQLGSTQRLGTVDEGLDDLDAERERRAAAVEGAGVEHVGVGDEVAASVDAQRLADAGDEEDHPDGRVGEQVAVAVDAAVAGQLTHGQPVLVEDADEAGRPALR